VEQNEKYGNTLTFNWINKRPKRKARNQSAGQTGQNRLAPNVKGIRRGWILSPTLFNLYSEYIIRTVGLEDMEAGVEIGG
jgi:hypothetical protein